MRDLRCVLQPLGTLGCFGRRNCNVYLDDLRWDRPDLYCEPQLARGVLAIFNRTRQKGRTGDDDDEVVLFGFRLRRPDLGCDGSCERPDLGCESLPGFGPLAANNVDL